MIELQFHGAAGTTTGSMHVLSDGDSCVCLDCGLFQGRRNETRDANEKFLLPAQRVQRVLLSHAHMDHAGRLPLLVKKGFTGPIYATPATRDLCEVMLPDSGHIQEEDAIFWNTKVAQRGEKKIAPLYTVADAMATLPHLRPAEYGEMVEVFHNAKAVFFEAGHILGSAMTMIDVNRNGDSFRILYTGDVGQFDMPIINDPTEPLPQCDYLITECTYADRRHGSAADMKDRLLRIIRETSAAGGKVIIPSFSVGRTQTLLYYLFELRKEGRLDDIPVFVDSPLSMQATEVFSNHPECYDREAVHLRWANGDFFHQDGLVRYVESVEESKALNDRRGPCVIIAASGMCESGRILHHLKNNIENPNNTVVVVGFMAQHTLGRRIVERREELKIYGKMYKLLARVEVLNGFSAHADVDGFRRLYQSIAPKLRRAFVVHGEETQPVAMAQLLHELGCPDVVAPTLGQKVKLE
jgi:metallo-beta-lactamase family protein